MKETRFFYVPDAASESFLPEEESSHALRVLRMQAGDEMFLMDGAGTYYKAVVTGTTRHECGYEITAVMPQKPQWAGHLHIAMAPTKMMDRTEWMLEKVTEVGVNEISLLNCMNSERRVVKAERLERILVSAMKQSRKPWKPVLNGMTPFGQFVSKPLAGRKFIAHCHPEIPRAYLFDELGKAGAADATVLIGPEGDFSMEEVREAVGLGFVSVHLGESRLRTETAAVVASVMMHLAG